MGPDEMRARTPRWRELARGQDDKTAEALLEEADALDAQAMEIEKAQWEVKGKLNSGVRGRLACGLHGTDTASPAKSPYLPPWRARTPLAAVDPAVATESYAKPKVYLASASPLSLPDEFSGLELSPAIATRIIEGILVGAEVRHITRNQNGLFTGHALFVGPSLFVKVSDDMSFKIAWSAQIPDETTGRLDLVNFERHQVLALIVKGF